MSSVLLDITNGVAKITLNRPEAFNALDPEMINCLSATIEQCFSEQVRAVVITGAGKLFCSGGDLKAMQAAGSESLPALLGEMTKTLHRLILDIRLLPKPVVAAINGPLGGAGFSLALACDIRFASEAARFKQAYTSVGLCPDGGFTALLPAVAGLATASELLFLDPALDAHQARQLGIVHQVFAPDTFAAEVDTIIEKLAAGATKSYATAKKLINQTMLPTLEKQLELERQSIMEIARTADAREGVNAFIEKRTPRFTGR